MVTRDLIGYHSARKMGFKWRAHGPDFEVRTNKTWNFLGARVFMLEGIRPKGRGRTQFFLLGYFCIDRVERLDVDELPYSLRGTEGKRITPVEINDEPWFAAFRQRQRNFASGLNDVGCAEFVQRLQELCN